MLSERLKWLSEFTMRRRQIASAYRAGIVNPLVGQLAAPEEDSAHVYHLYVVTCEQRDALQAHLQQNQIQSHIHYPIPVHKQVPCRNLPCDSQGLTNSERHAASCLSLPCHPQLTDGDIISIISSVNSFRGKQG
jgi:dTDP-4-amino-4,6-dideoxygalactose transaminase